MHAIGIPHRPKPPTSNVASSFRPEARRAEAASAWIFFEVREPAAGELAEEPVAAAEKERVGCSEPEAATEG
jgi:hypothetical protein